MDVLKTKKERIEELQKKIIIRTTEFRGEVSVFDYFLKEAAAMKLHSFTSDKCIYKPNLNEFENIMFNLEILKEMFDYISDAQVLQE